MSAELTQIRALTLAEMELVLALSPSDRCKVAMGGGAGGGRGRAGGSSPRPSPQVGPYLRRISFAYSTKSGFEWENLQAAPLGHTPSFIEW